MESLPPELQAKVASHLCATDLKSLRLVNKQCAGVAARPLFEVLHFSGEAQQDHNQNDPRILHRGRKKTVEYGKLSETVAEVLGVAHLVKTLKFDPAYYRARFWDDYRRYLEELDDPIDDPWSDISEEEHSAWLESSDDYEGAFDRAFERRINRPEREAPKIEAAERVWNEKMAEQTANEGAILTALTRLLERTKMLQRIDILPWEFNGYNGLQFNSAYNIDCQRPEASPTALFLGVIAQALQAANRNIRHLYVNELVMPDTLSSIREAGLRYVFSGLQKLQIGMQYVEFLLEESPEKPGSVTMMKKLMQCSRNSLKSLEILGGGRWHHLPARGAHSLLNILSSDQASDSDNQEPKPLVFPELEYVRLGSLILSTPSLIKFLAAQPKIASVDFLYIYLATPGLRWPDVVQALPASVRTWKLSGQAGHEPHPGATLPIAYNWIIKWNPFIEGIPEGTGWKPAWKNADDARNGLNFVRIIDDGKVTAP